MKKTMIAGVLIGLSLPVMAQAMEFQTPGTLGMGRSGVARTTDAYATFINPAGLAFSEKTFSMKLGAIAGVAITSSLADNIDKVGKLELDSSDMTYTTGASISEVSAATAKAAQFAGILNDLNDKKGDLTVNVNLALGFQYSTYGFGIIGVSEVGAGIGTIDLINIRAGNETMTTSVSQLATDIGVVPNSSNGIATYFGQTQYDGVVTALRNAGSITQQQAQDLVSTLETKLKAEGVNTSGLTPDQIAQGLITIAPSLGGTADTIDNNKTTVLLRGIAIAEIPLAYGYKFDLGKFGKLGVGGAAKIMQGTVYSTDVEVMSLDDSSDITDRVKDNHSESTQFGIDLGALWRLEDVRYIGPVNVGLALKNLNSPKFDGPTDPITGAVASKVKVQPQARIGIALDPASWLSIAADMDLTKNKTVIEGRDSQLLGGGIEARFDNWYALYLALRAGAYKNIGETGSKPIITAGLSLGPQWLRLDVNGAFATEKAQYDNKSYPNEAKVEFGLSTAF
ncbi:MAG: conjugal transfer protein TraF [Desulfuromonadaceae bacterium]|nr:conjugal transfer protein TraF [Desulfuromonadaceae bacterium]MDD5104611.1 conjugal transfer protein TraF [Desulfuromonadaceae bacterium]